MIKASYKIAAMGLAGVLFGLGLKGLVEPKVEDINPWILAILGLGLMLIVTGKIKLGGIKI